MRVESSKSKTENGFALGLSTFDFRLLPALNALKHARSARPRERPIQAGYGRQEGLFGRLADQLAIKVLCLATCPEARKEGQGRKTNPNKPKWIKFNIFSNLIDFLEKQTQWTYPACYEPLAELLPLILLQNGSSHSRIDRRRADGKALSKANPSKPIELNSFWVNNMSRSPKKQTQLGYHAYYQSIAAILPCLSDENGWIGH